MELLQSEDRAYFKAEASGRITCTLNGHTFPALEEPIRAFTKCATPLVGDEMPLQLRVSSDVLYFSVILHCITSPVALCSGTRYRRLRVVAEEEAKLKQYEPLLVQSRNFP